MNTQDWIDKIYNLTLEFGPKLIGAFLIWIIGGFIIKLLMKGAHKAMTKSNYDDSLKKFLSNLIGWALKILLIVVILSTVGIETTSFAAILAAAGLAVGMALQGSLGNFAGGVLIMIFKPFKIGDLIEVQGQIGVVKEIEIFTTKLTGLSNREIILPNGNLSNDTIINFTTEGTRRVDLVFGIGYDEDIKKAKEVFISVLKAHPKVLTSIEPTVDVIELADSSVNFAVRPWCNTEDYWRVYFDITEQTKIALDEAGIDIPYPHAVEIQKEG
ncbi:mechanosensitive ion channel protein [Winogradskyella sp. PC-19]|uniref:mechanosensitive ion channel family protein n=1 Tax=unclassified Winogradskyella TaxID=2615021 RepID=UPI000B3BF8C1|nr:MULTISPECIES: mechanosensitive ion channel domain-containing protein [unclassified Winogradskyella]ARV09439.1 mechanosensitive ion channel protein [Winogradskyella sp. PC-19]RZN83963.1 MAG: mechanosensitive ion channel [Winogradskyella sp.]